MHKKIEEILLAQKSNPLFKGIDNQGIKELSYCAQYAEVKSGEYIIHARENKHCIYIVAEGKLKAEIMGEEDVIYSPNDFFGEIAFVNEHYRAASVTAQEDSLLIGINHQYLHSGAISDKTLKSLLINIVERITSYLRTQANTSTNLLVQGGETNKVEFKSTLRYNIHSGKFDKNIEHASLKTIAAFLNSDGGTLLIGVEDNGNIYGLDQDKFANDDKAQLHLTNLIKSKISMHHLTFIRIHNETMQNKKIMRIDVNPASIPAYIRDNNDEMFYIRTGPSTSLLKVSELYGYIQKRFRD